MDNTISFQCLSSSSIHGNCCLVTAGSTNILVDCGISLRRLERTLRERGVDPWDIDAVLITHEHGDHTKALALKTPFPARYDAEVYGTELFWQAWTVRCPTMPDRWKRTIKVDQPVQIGDLTVSAFTKSHDCADPVGFCIATGSQKLGVVTDLGEVNGQMTDMVKGADYLLFESNHCPQMELNSGRPWFLIQRVMGEMGHLSNEQAAKALCNIVTETTKTVVLGHLSCDCNVPDRARSVVGKALRQIGWDGELLVAPAGEPTCVIG